MGTNNHISSLMSIAVSIKGYVITVIMQNFKKSHSSSTFLKYMFFNPNSPKFPSRTVVSKPLLLKCAKVMAYGSLLSDPAALERNIELVMFEEDFLSKITKVI